MDFARSDDARVQAQLDRLPKASSAGDILTLDRIRELCARLGDPQDRLPPVLHVAGTNGKGSTIAWLRAAIEGAGGTVHAYTSPHLVRFNERIRIAGRLIEDRELAPLLERVIDAGEGLDASFFEVATAVAFLAFERSSADATLVEVGLGGRLDATNVVTPLVTGIAALGIDHARILGATIDRIALEKAGIAKPGVPLVTMRHGAEVDQLIADHAAKVGAPLVPVHECAVRSGLGATQDRNLALAATMLQSQSTVAHDIARAPDLFSWPARMQLLGDGPLTRGLHATVTLDGAHNAQGAEQLAATIAKPISLVVGILANRDPQGILAPFAGKVARVIAVPIPGHDHHETRTLAEIADRVLGLGDSIAASDIEDAFALLRRDFPDEPVLVMGSLYLAGEVLRLNREIPD